MFNQDSSDGKEAVMVDDHDNQCQHQSYGSNLLAQKVVLIASSVLFVIQLVGVASTEWESILSTQTGINSEVFTKKVNEMTLFKILIFFAAEGIAILRCFRVFRLLWFYELEDFRRTVHWWFDPFVGKPLVHRLFHVFKFAVRGLSALGNEMFRLTTATRGGLLLMGVFFYSAYVFGAALWVESGTSDNLCATLGECMYTMVRLSLLDGNGFDYAFSLTDHHVIMFYFVMLYMCITSFGILNGLVGLFGHAFKQASEESFRDDGSRNTDSFHADDDIVDYQEFDDLGKSFRKRHPRGDQSPPSGENDKATLSHKQKPGERGRVGKTVGSLANKSNLHFKLHKVASTHLIRKYYSTKTSIGPSQKSDPEVSLPVKDAKVHPSPRVVESVRAPSVHGSPEIHEQSKQILQMVDSLHSHIQHLNGKMESQSSVVVDIFQKMSDLYRQFEQQQEAMRDASERHERQLDQLHNKIAFTQYPPSNFEQEQGYEQQQQLGYEQQHGGYDQQYPVFQQGGMGFQQQDNMTSQSPSRLQVNSAFGIDSVIDIGNDSPRSQITFAEGEGDLMSFRSEAQDPSPSTRAFIPLGPPITQKVSNQKLKPMDWNKQGGASLALTVPFIAWAFIVSVQYNTHKKLSRLDDSPGDSEGLETRNDDLESLKNSQQKSINIRNKALIFRLQILSIRCALCLPLYALCLYLSLFSPQLFFVFEVVITLLEGYFIYCFFALLVTNLGGPTGTISKLQSCCPSDAVDFYHRSERVIFLTVPIRTLLSIGSAITTAMADTRKKDTLVVAISLLLSASSAILLLYAVSCLVNLYERLYDSCRNVNGVSKLFLLKFSVTLIVVQELLQQGLTESSAAVTPFQDDDQYSVADKMQLAYCLIVLVELALLSLWSYLTFRLPISSPEGDNLTFSHSTVSSHTPNSSVDCDSTGIDEQNKPESFGRFFCCILQLLDVFNDSITPLRDMSRRVGRHKVRTFSAEEGNDFYNIMNRRPFSNEDSVSVLIDSNGRVRPLQDGFS
eukprot:gene26833-35525_t